MLKQVRRHLLDHLPAGVDPGGLLDRVVSIDAARGVVDGVCYLLLDDRGDPLLVAKSARTPGGKAIFRTEHETLSALDAGGLNAAAPGAPRPIGLWDDDGTLVTLQSALKGRLLKNEPGPALFGEGRFAATFAEVRRWYDRFLASTQFESAAITDAVYDREVIAPTNRFLARFRNPTPDRRLLENRLLGERRLLNSVLPLTPRHGDFCTANMVLQPQGLGVFDWEFDLAPRLPLFDPLFFVSSTRWPHRGLRGESSHFKSFVAVFWGNEPFALAAREFVRRIGESNAIPHDALADLFLVALVHVANMKYEGLVEAAGIEIAADDAVTIGRPYDDTARQRLWALLPRADKDVPFACVRDGRLENLSEVVRRGLPAF